MYIADGTETLILIRNKVNRDHLPAGEHRIAVDAESYAHYLNDPDIEVLSEEMQFSRLDPLQYPHLQHEGMNR